MTIKSFSSLSIFIMVFLYGLVGCATNPTSLATSSSTPGQSGYPSAGSTQATKPGYPSPAQVTSAPTLIPKNIAPSSNQVGLIKGVLVVIPPDTENTIPGIYLGVINRDTKGNPLITSLDKSKAPKALFDQKGNFVIQDVKPGEYTLLVDMVESVFILKDTNGKELFLQVQGGKTIDVGEIKIVK